MDCEYYRQHCRWSLFQVFLHCTTNNYNLSKIVKNLWDIEKEVEVSELNLSLLCESYESRKHEELGYLGISFGKLWTEGKDMSHKLITHSWSFHIELWCWKENHSNWVIVIQLIQTNMIKAHFKKIISFPEEKDSFQISLSHNSLTTLHKSFSRLKRILCLGFFFWCRCGI